ncbi:uncharacterized protein LY89DRAFT_510039 [Mollisia scopiformis]|uniref:Uncharacterized protein n=1 Tax=Mollisia scopiformis TaxID=149040 RepID=A0A194XGW5_MOLSC|nr:uncharacterized protein LY89DRAFT_510039 [Mollisia scopiformis]KUJ19012.1 hypothetical protein LY89DRAFT_510039 [Mollisia scopiformis]
MREVMKMGHQKYWLPLLEKKIANEPITKEELDEFLGDFAGVSDIPAAIFAPEFMDAYPEAKIVLTTRDEEKWFESMKATIWHAKNSPFGQTMSDYLWGNDREGEGKMRFLRHNEKVRSAAKERGREVLEFEVKEGWKPLCSFLGPEERNREFPRSDDWAAYKKETQGKESSQQ